jgi:hypothetical protein
LEEARASAAFAHVEAPSVSPPTRPGSESANSDEFDRPPRANVLRIRFNQNSGKVLVPISSIQKSFNELLDEKGWSHDICKIEGNEVGKNFSAIFSSGVPADIGGGQVEELLRLLKPNGKWRNVQVADVPGNQTQMFVNKDCSPKTNKTRALCRKLIDVLKNSADELSEKEFFFRLSDGQVSVDYQPLAKLKVSKDDVSVQWAQARVDLYNLDKVRVTAQFLAATTLQWVS